MGVSMRKSSNILYRRVSSKPCFICFITTRYYELMLISIYIYNYIYIPSDRTQLKDKLNDSKLSIQGWSRTNGGEMIEDLWKDGGIDEN